MSDVEFLVYAASAYDDLITITPDLTLTSPSSFNCQEPLSSDFSLNWYNSGKEVYQKVVDMYPNDLSAQQRLNEYENFIKSSVEGHWLVLKSPDDSSFSVIATTDASAHLEFFIDSNSQPSLRLISSSNDIRDFGNFLYCKGLFPYTPDNGLSNSSPLNRYTSLTIDTVNDFFISTFPIIYPDGYSGELIPDSYDPPSINDSTPDFFVVSSVNGLVTIRDRRFNTFDNVPFMCEDGLTPYIRYSLNDLDHYLIFDTGGFSPTVDYQFQLPVKNQIINYEFSGRYDCGDNTEPSFPNSSSVQFQLDPLGGLKTDLFEECISQEFPFIHYEGCYENVMRMLNMLSFSSLKINGWTYNAQCRQLTVLGGWLGTQPGQVICPNFSPQVRNTVTPFIAFFLGLTMFGFLLHRKGGL